MPVLPLPDLPALDRAVEGGHVSRADYVSRKAWLQAHARPDGRVEVPDGWLGDVPLPAPRAVSQRDAGPAVPGPWLSTLLRVLGVVSVLAGLVGLAVGLGESAVYSSYSGEAIGVSGAALAGAAATALSGLVTAAVLLTLAQVLDVLRALARRTWPAGGA